MVPHLTTALSGPLLELEKRLLEATPRIEHWFRGEWQQHAAPFYGSVDLRNSGFKLAPVDTNLFPGGFNNLNPDFLPLCVHAAMTAVEKICPQTQRVLLVPENHTRNRFYLQNVAALRTILEHAGLEVRIGTLDAGAEQSVEVDGAPPLKLEPLRRVGDHVLVEDFDSCVVLLNNDLSAGIPELLRGLEQVVIPPLHAGWAVRRKSNHFSAYNRVADKFAALVGVDPWLINPYFATCGQINFHERKGEECLAGFIDEMLQDIRKKYAEYDIKEAPFVIVKADAGTYGMGIMSVKDASEVRNLNRKQRNKMSVIKEGQHVTEVIIQEGVHTFETINDAVAEPVVYLIDHFVVGGFYRVHTTRGVDENLNAPGMHFEPLAFETVCTLPDRRAAPRSTPNRFYAYGVIARLAMLAAAIELEDTVDAAEETAEVAHYAQS